MRRRVVVGTFVGALVAAAAVALLRGEGAPDRSAAHPESSARLATRRTGRQSPPSDERSPAQPRAATPDSAFDALDAAVRAGDAAAARLAAAHLRRLLRTDADAWEVAVRRLLDASASPESRAALAFVVGTVDRPETDRALIDALSTARGVAVLERALLLALGATRTPPDEDDVFDLGDHPWGAVGPAGLGITVRRSMADEAARSAVAARLAGGTPTSRWAAATSLRHSLEKPDARAAFEQSLAAESDDAPAAVVGEALASFSRRASDVTERERILRALVARAAVDGMDGLRFRIVDDLAGVPLPPDVRATLASDAESPHSFALRTFALDLLAGAASTDDETRAVARALLTRFIESDADASMRDASARLMRKAGQDDSCAAALLRAVRQDAAWNVRYTALETLVAGGRGGADAALALAARDADERVRALAARLAVPVAPQRR